MYNCAGFIELISAYADGELAEPDRRRVEEHLETCEQCSALLEMYREISIAADESCVPAPDALRDGVMEKIISMDTAGNAGTDKKPRLVRTVLTRYLPVAACLAVMLISLPWIINYNSSRSGGTGGGFSPAGEQVAETFAAPFALNETPDSMQDMSGDGDLATFSIAPDAPEGSASTFSVGTAIPEEYMTRSGNGAVSEADEPESAQAGTRVQTDLAADSSTPPVQASALIPADDAWQGAAAESGDLPGPSENWISMEGFEDAYAWVEITGDLPKILLKQEPEPLPDGLAFEAYCKIPVSVVEELKKESGLRNGIEIVLNNADSDYAIVFWTPNK